MTNNITTTDAATETALPLWHQTGWDGPVVETRPEDAGPEWPEGAVERVTFTRERFPNDAFPECLPFTEYFGADGWPHRTPNEVKAYLDPLMRAEFHREPWTYRPEEWQPRNWVKFARSYDEFLLREAELGVTRTLVSAKTLPEPCIQA